MEIKFFIEPDVDTDDYRELYTVDVTFEDGTNFTLRMNEDEISYDQFKADVYEDLFKSLCEANDIELTIEEEDYANLDLEFELIDDILDEYLSDENNGC